MGPPVYPPAQQDPQPFYRPDYQFGYPQGKGKIFSGVHMQRPRPMSEVINPVWESITINRLNNQTWSDNKAKLAFVENLLGESEKLMWQQWRTAYPGAYSALEAIADKQQNITSQVRPMATKSEDCNFPLKTTQKPFWPNFPPFLSKKMRYHSGHYNPGLSSRVLPAIKFTYTFILEMCKDAALAKELRDLSLCSAIPIPDFDDSSVYSISEGEGDTHQSISVMVQDTPVEETIFMAIEEDDDSDDELEKVIPEEALEPLTQTVVFNGLNSSQQTTHKIKKGYFLIEKSKFKIPLIYAFDMRDNNGIEMLKGANFLRSMKGGIRDIEVPEDSSLEWLVMPFGLKNAPAVFQRKMDKCFKDGCIEGWGGIVKWKRARRIQESSERNLWHMQVAKFSTTQPQLMRNQCHANNTIGEMKILLPGQTRKSTLRTNVKLSLVFYNKNNSNRIRQGFSMEQNAHYKYGISGSSRRLYTVYDAPPDTTPIEEIAATKNSVHGIDSSSIAT
ncbi:hypothetical protein Tco_0974908 [Tanacetum coccineum]|uniref:Uncharacterized protein n=1 Tax=Tanacetum coccineum TaxID=301880 RepID=A0ABQ5ECU9_9ASTR